MRLFKGGFAKVQISLVYTVFCFLYLIRSFIFGLFKGMTRALEGDKAIWEGKGGKQWGKGHFRFLPIEKKRENVIKFFLAEKTRGQITVLNYWYFSYIPFLLAEIRRMR